MLTSCPDRTTLRSYLEGNLGEHEEADVDKHVETCLECQRTMDDIIGPGHGPFGFLANGEDDDE